MKEYKIYANPQGRIEAVKEGWSWLAFFFALPWVLIKRMWARSIGLFFLSFILGGVAAIGEGLEWFSMILGLIICIVCGVKGNKWREKNLPSRGYEYKDTVSASTPEGAIALWIKKGRR